MHNVLSVDICSKSACSRGIVFCSHFPPSSLSVARRVLKLNFELFRTCLTANERPARSQSWIRCTRLLRSRFKFTIIVKTNSSTNRDVCRTLRFWASQSICCRMCILDGKSVLWWLGRICLVSLSGTPRCCTTVEKTWAKYLSVQKVHNWRWRLLRRPGPPNTTTGAYVVLN